MDNDIQNDNIIKDDDYQFKLIAVPFKIKKSFSKKENLDVFIQNEFNIRLTKTQYIYIKQVVNNELEIISCLNDIIEKI
jgi:hypothetical protein